MADARSYDPSYRQEDVDATLDRHENRISRLEKALLIVLGYGVAEGGNMVSTLVQVF